MARPETLRQLAATRFELQDLKKHADRLKRRGETVTQELRKEIKDATKLYEQLDEQAHQEDLANGVSWAVAREKERTATQ